MGIVSDLVKDVALPNMARIRQHTECPTIDNLEQELRNQLERDCIAQTVKPGASIAIGVGSRGVNNLKEVTRGVVSWLKEKGAKPFIIPAMGSHGGAVAEGQVEILEGYGVTEEYCGCPVRATMETVQIGVTEKGGFKVFIDKYAAEADAIVVINRVKPHTAFRGEYESGVMKMLTIGLGKQKGADSCHDEGFQNMGEMVPMFGKVILKNAPILFGVALVENALEQTCLVQTLTPDEIINKEPDLLKYAKSLMPKLPFDKVDVLVVDKIGKNFSGDGMDPNITGTFCTKYATGGIDAQRVVVLDLSDETHGNAVGAGMAHVVSARVLNKFDREKSYPNAITSKEVRTVAIPLTMESDRLAIQCALKTCSEINMANPEIIRIANSLHVQDMWVSEALYEKALKMENIEILEKPSAIRFDDAGNLF